MGRGGRLRVLVAVLAALLAVAVAGAAAPRVSAGSLSTILFGGQDSGTFISFGNGGGIQSLTFNLLPSKAPLPRKLSVEVPTGFTFDLSAAPGKAVAEAFISVAGVDQPSSADGFGDLVAADPAAYAGDPCDPVAHAAVWKATIAIAGQDVTVTVFVDQGGPQGVAYTLQTCPTGLAGGSAGQSEFSLTLAGLEPLTAPTAAGRYVWRAIATPQDGQPYELQAVVPLPERVTMTARYDTHKRVAILTGKVLEGGKPVARADLALGSLNGSLGGPNETRTGADGSFTFRAPAKRTTDFDVSVQPTSGPCEEAPTAPGGCASSMIVPPDDATATVWVSAPGGAVRATRTADQRLAEREVLTGSDLTPDFQPFGLAGHACENQSRESALTITGETASPVYLRFNGDQDNPVLADATTLVRVYATAKQAQAAFEREAVAATAKCELTAAGIKKPKVTAYRQPGLAASTRGFRTVLPATKTTKGSIDLLFLKRGRSVVRLNVTVIPVSAAVERTLAAKIASRMR